MADRAGDEPIEGGKTLSLTLRGSVLEGSRSRHPGGAYVAGAAVDGQVVAEMVGTSGAGHVGG